MQKRNDNRRGGAMIPVESIPNWLKLRRVHFEQLLQNVLDCERDGSYYGNKKHHFKRHEELKEWVKGIIDMFDK